MEEGHSAESASAASAPPPIPARPNHIRTAAVALQLKHHASAMHLLETLFANIEPVEELVAVRVAFLLLEIYALAFRCCAKTDPVRCQQV